MGLGGLLEGILYLALVDYSSGVLCWSVSVVSLPDSEGFVEVENANAFSGGLADEGGRHCSFEEPPRSGLASCCTQKSKNADD